MAIPRINLRLEYVENFTTRQIVFAVGYEVYSYLDNDEVTDYGIRANPCTQWTDSSVLYLFADKDGISFKFHKDSGFAKATYIMCGSRGVRIDRQIGANSKFKNSGTVVISRLDDEEMDPVLLIVDGVENFIRELQNRP